MMEVFERIKYLRISLLRIKSQDEFAKKINISRSNLASIEIGRIKVTDRVISDICEKYNVSEEWLRYGQGDWKDESKEDYIDNLAKEYKLDGFMKSMLNAFAALKSDDEREMVHRFLNSLMNSPADLGITDTKPADVKEWNKGLTEEEEVALVRKRHADAKKGGA